MMRVKCDSTHGMTELSVFSALASGLLGLTTVPLNGAILVCLIRDIFSNKAKYKIFFYKIIINITLADLCKGIFADTSALIWHTREATGTGALYMSVDVPFVHVSMFITDGVALVCMAILSIERILALLKPHFQLQKTTQILILFSSWPISVVILLPYQTVGFLTELIIFLTCTNSIAIISLILLTSIYRYRFRAPYSRSISLSKLGGSISSITNLESSITYDTAHSVNEENEIHQEMASPSPLARISKMTRTWSAPNIKTNKKRQVQISSSTPTDTSTLPTKLEGQADMSAKNMKRNLSEADPMHIGELERSSAIIAVNTTNKQFLTAEQKKRRRKRSSSLGNLAAISQPFQRCKSTSSSIRAKQGKRERKVTVAFLKMLLVFISTYIPTLVMMVFLNLPYPNCNTVHVLRDLSVLAILSSSLFRAINFLATLKHVRESVKRMANMKTERRKASK